MRTFAALAAACLVGFIILIAYQPNITFDEGFEAECRSVASPGPHGGLLGPNGGPIESSVVSGDAAFEEFDQSFDDTDPNGDHYAAQRVLDAACTNKRTQVLVQAMVAAMGFVLFTAFAAVARVRAPLTP